MKTEFINTDETGAYVWVFLYNQFIKQYVKKVTPTGIIVTQRDRRFKNGKEHKSKNYPYPDGQLVPEEYALEQINQVEYRQKVREAINSLHEALAGRRSSDGNYHINQEVVDSIIKTTELVKQNN